MILVKPSFKILTDVEGLGILRRIEQAGRICYKSENKITDESAEKFVERIIAFGHHSIIEHANISVKITCDRGVTHEIVRHRLVAYSQESTRYCNYKGGVTFVIPPWINIEEGEYVRSTSTILNGEKYGGLYTWFAHMWESEDAYMQALKYGWTPQQARSVLPNSLKTEIVMTANIREWRHILKLRTSKAAHPQMQETMIPILAEFRELMPILFDNL